MEGSTKLTVLVEDETLFLPHLLAKLAQKGLIQKVVILSHPFSYQRFQRNVLQLYKCFGLSVFLALILSTAIGSILNILCKYKFYSIKKVLSVYRIPSIIIPKVHSQELYTLLDQNPQEVVFAQVSQKLKPDLLQRAVFWNKHCSILPSYKGVYPIFWAMLNEQSHLGTSIHVMNEQFDEGFVLSQTQISNRNLTFFEAYHRLYDLTAVLLIDLCLYNLRQKVDSDAKSSYYSFPTPLDRNHFKQRCRFGFPLRLHPSVKPK